MKNINVALLVLSVLTLAVMVFAVPIHAPYPEGSRQVGTSFPLPVGQNMIFSGVLGSQTITATTGAAVALSALPEGTRFAEIFSATDVNYGGATVNTGTDEPFVAANTTKTLIVATTTPVLYFRGRAATATVRIVSFK